MANSYWDVQPELSQTTKEVLERYSKIPPDQVLDHCTKIVSPIELASHVTIDTE